MRIALIVIIQFTILLGCSLADESVEIAHSEFGRFRIYRGNTLELLDTKTNTRRTVSAHPYPLSTEEGVYGAKSHEIFWSPDERLFAMTVHHHRHSSGTFLFYIGTKETARIPTGLEDNGWAEFSPTKWLTTRLLLLGTAKSHYNVLRVDTRTLRATVQKLK